MHGQKAIQHDSTPCVVQAAFCNHNYDSCRLAHLNSAPLLHMFTFGMKSQTHLHIRTGDHMQAD